MIVAGPGIPWRHFVSLTMLALLFLSMVAGIVVSAGPHSHAFAQAVPAQPDAAVSETSAARYGAIADILEDDAARARLIADLRALEDSGSPPLAIDIPPEHQIATGAPSGQAPDDVSVARQIAQYTQAMAEGTVNEVVSLFQSVRSLDTGEIARNLSALTPAVVDLAVVIFTALAVYWIVRRLVAPVFSRASAWVLADRGSYHPLKRVTAVLGSAIVDGFAILLAWVAGYAVALFAFGTAGEMDTRQSLFLNAFLLVETFKLVLRVLFASRYEGLRLLPVSAVSATYWNTWLARVSGWIGYGLLVAVPIVNFNVSPVAGRLLSVLIMLAALLYAFRAVMRRRQQVRSAIHARAESGQLQLTRQALLALGNYWHFIAIAYFAGLTIVTLFRPEDALPFMVLATVQSIVSIGVGLIISMLISRVIANGIRIPDETQRRLPMLQQRLNAFIPAGLRVVRIVLLVAVVIAVAHSWGLFDAAAWLASDSGAHMVTITTTVAAILFVAAAIWITIASWIEHRLSPETGKGEPGPREKTLLTIFRNAFAIVLITMTSMIALSEIGINIGPLIAGAGVLGLAIGFGAQSLVQDIITGIFIQLENAMNAGDVVTAGPVTGTVERLTIRSVGIRDLSGTYHIIPFSAVSTVSNYMRDFGYHVGEYGIAYRENTDDALAHMRNAFDELRTDPEHSGNIIGDLEVHGVTGLGDSAVTLRVRIKTRPGTQWGIGRAYNRLVKKHFDAAGIEIPYPHVTLYFGEGKDGSAPAAPVRLLDAGHKEAQTPLPTSAT